MLEYFREHAFYTCPMEVGHDGSQRHTLYLDHLDYEAAGRRERLPLGRVVQEPLRKVREGGLRLRLRGLEHETHPGADGAGGQARGRGMRGVHRGPEPVPRGGKRVRLGDVREARPDRPASRRSRDSVRRQDRQGARLSRGPGQAVHVPASPCEGNSLARKDLRRLCRARGRERDTDTGDGDRRRVQGNGEQPDETGGVRHPCPPRSEPSRVRVLCADLRGLSRAH